ncbi:GH17195 [Drosophila grimshawi]|uniref:GH17195 n=2 Tax=Drosophila grimshawi TaxID=7222 RepID=B4J1T8_DROGR|nr:GH17195 [Drosophila grimshawi]
MTLLPRTKQPPPMYGARGSTVPAKYIKHDQQDTNKAPTTLYTPSPTPEHCANCSMELATDHDMRRHLDQHEFCPAEDCSFVALASVMERHIEANHITGLYKTVRKVWTPEDISAWRAERCKRFPTATNVEKAKRAKEQRVKRGERLESSKPHFAKSGDRRRSGPLTNTNDRKTQTKRQRRTVKMAVGQIEQQKVRMEQEKRDTSLLEDAVYLNPTLVPIFPGTSRMTDYEHIEAKVKSKQNALSNMLGMYGTDSDDDDEPIDAENTVEVVDSPITVVNSIISIDTTKEQRQIKTMLVELTQECSAKTLVDTDSMNVSSSSDEGPEELPIERKVEAFSAPSAPQKLKSSTDKIERSSRPTTRHSSGREKPIYGLNYKRARETSKQNTMLSKLLASDIRHERNVLLQCVRYVCEQNFFDIGSSAISLTTETINISKDVNA